MKKKKILMLVCMAVLAVTVVIPVNAAKKTNKKQIQVLNLYQDQKTDIEEAEYLVSYLEDKNIDEESVEKQEKEEWYIDIKTGKITKDSQYKRHFYNDGWTIEFKDDKGKILYSTEDEELGQGIYAVSTPIYDEKDELFATLSITGLSVTLRGNQELIDELLAASKNLSYSF